jgi:hypothetical protein
LPVGGAFETGVWKRDDGDKRQKKAMSLFSVVPKFEWILYLGKFKYMLLAIKDRLVLYFIVLKI